VGDSKAAGAVRPGLFEPQFSPHYNTPRGPVSDLFNVAELKQSFSEGPREKRQM
jgi:hypothetical protein